MQLVYTNDQVLPVQETDTEQLMSMVSALGHIGVDVRLLLPGVWGKLSATGSQLAQYYQVDKTFKVKILKSLFPSNRALEKLGHAIICVLEERIGQSDFLYTRNLPTVFAALAFSRHLVLYETFRPWPDQNKHLIPLLKFMVQHKRFLGVVTHSALAGKSFLNIGMPQERLLVAYNGYDPQRMKPELTKDEARRKLDLPQEVKIVTYAGHVNMDKGLGLMLALADKLKDVLFLIIGSQGEGEVERQAANLENVRIIPWQEFAQTVPYLYASDVLFIPPTKGPLERVGNTVLPIKTFLYMAAGRPIFGPSTPDLLEILEDGRNAVLVETDNIKTALLRLRELLADKSSLCTLGENAKKDVLEMTWINRAKHVRDFCSSRLTDIGEGRQ